MVSGQNGPQEILEFLSRHVPTHREPTQSQNMIRQLSQDTTLSILENTHERASNDHNASINRILEAFAGITYQQRLALSAISKPASRNTLMFGGKN